MDQPDHTTLDVLIKIGLGLWTAVLGAFTYVFKKKIDMLERHDKAIIKLNETTITADQARLIAEEKVSDIKGDLSEIKTLLENNNQATADTREKLARLEGFIAGFKDNG